jgi:hypothetical protein
MAAASLLLPSGPRFGLVNRAVADELVTPFTVFVGVKVPSSAALIVNNATDS